MYLPWSNHKNMDPIGIKVPGISSVRLCRVLTNLVTTTTNYMLIMVTMTTKFTSIQV